MSLSDYLQAALPACVTFGPAFLVMAGRDERRTRFVRALGAVMVGVALLTIWLMTSWQNHQISLLEQKVESLEGRARSAR